MISKPKIYADVNLKQKKEYYTYDDLEITWG